MKTKTKVALTALCALLLVAASVLGTLAYLTSKADVTNTFTVGKVEITLDEAVTNVDGKPLDDGGNVVLDVANAKRASTGNKLHLIPGSTYTKDPTVHVKKGSEDSYIFIKITDDIAAIQQSQTVKQQILANGWTEYSVDNVYYREYPQDNDKDVDYAVFKTLTVKSDATSTDLAAIGNELIINAYAIQKENFDSVDEAWAALGV